MPLPIPFHRFLIPASLMTCASLVVTGCGQSIERSKAFREQQKTVAQIKEENQNLGGRLEAVNATLAQLSQTLDELRRTPGSAGQVSAEIDNRLKELHGLTTENTRRLAQLEGRTKEEGRGAAATTVARESQGADAPKIVPAGGTEKASKPRASDKAEASAKPGAKTEKSTSEKRAPKETADAGSRAPGSTQVRITRTSNPAGGGYYNVKAGDTAESIASRHKTTPRALATANGIPQGSNFRVFTGQRLFIPASGR